MSGLSLSVWLVIMPPHTKIPGLNWGEVSNNLLLLWHLPPWVVAVPPTLVQNLHLLLWVCVSVMFLRRSKGNHQFTLPFWHESSFLCYQDQHHCRYTLDRVQVVVHSWSLNHQQDDGALWYGKKPASTISWLSILLLGPIPQSLIREKGSWFGCAAPSSVRIDKKSVKSHAREQLILETDVGGILCFHPIRSSGSFHQNPIPISKVNTSSPRFPSSTGLTRAVGPIPTSATLQDEIYIREHYFSANFIHYSLPWAYTILTSLNFHFLICKIGQNPCLGKL